MTDIHWYTILLVAVIILGSSVIESVIYAAISAYQNKKQAIASRVDVFPAFDDTFGVSGLRNHITISDS